MSDLISRQKVLMYLADLQLSVTPDDTRPTPLAYTALEWAIKGVENLPSAEPKKGKWEVKTDGFIFKRRWGICSECGNYLDFLRVNVGRGDANFCPNCGAKMIEKDEI